MPPPIRPVHFIPSTAAATNQRRQRQQDALAAVQFYQQTISTAATNIIAPTTQTPQCADSSNHPSATPIVNQQYCTRCDMQVTEPMLDHLTSIAHMHSTMTNTINPDGAIEPRQSPPAVYALNERNSIGHRMLVKSGWNVERGLGVEEQGRRRPVAARRKLDRAGIGAAPTARRTRSATTSTSTTASTTSAADLQQPSTALLTRQHRRQALRQRHKDQQELEKRIRAEFGGRPNG